MLAKLLLFYLQTHMQKTPNNEPLKNENKMWKWISLYLIPQKKFKKLKTNKKKKKKKKHLKKRFKFIYVEVSVDFRRNLLKKTKAEDRFQIRKE